MITIDDFEKIDIRVGKVIDVKDFPEAKKPAYKLWIDFGGELGVKTSSAQIVKNQTKEDLLNKQVICVVNFPERQVGPFISQVLTLGASDGTTDASNWIVLRPFKTAELGSKIA